MQDANQKQGPENFRLKLMPNFAPKYLTFQIEIENSNKYECVKECEVGENQSGPEM